MKTEARADPEPVIRAATRDDAESCGELLFSTWPHLYLALLGDERRAKGTLAALFRAPGNTFSFDATRVASRQGRIIALASSYLSSEGERRAQGSIWPAFRAMGPLRFFRVLAAVFRISDATMGVDPRHYYVANVAVAAPEQGLGVGRMLLADAERRGRALSRPGISLEVDASNVRAVSFYARFGYRVVDMRESQGLAVLTGQGRRFLMSKDLPAEPF